MVEAIAPVGNAVPEAMFQSAGRIIGWLKLNPAARVRGQVLVSIRRADYWLVEDRPRADNGTARRVSIRRADYWLVEGVVLPHEGVKRLVSIRRADYWLVEAPAFTLFDQAIQKFQSAGRIIGWLKLAVRRLPWSAKGFNPPGGLLVG